MFAYQAISIMGDNTLEMKVYRQGQKLRRRKRSRRRRNLRRKSKKEEFRNCTN